MSRLLIILATFLVLSANPGERPEPRYLSQCEWLRFEARYAKHEYAMFQTAQARQKWARTRRTFERHCGEAAQKGERNEHQKMGADDQPMHHLSGVG